MPVPFETAVDACTVTDVQLSPDGSRVVYGTGRASQGKDTPPVTKLWLADADGPAGSPARRLSSSEAADGAPRWSPDGTRLAFLSDRAERGVRQVYLLDLARGGEALRLTEHKSGVSALDWSPDGAWIAYTAPDEPTEEETERKKSRDEIVADADVKLTGLWLLTVPADAATLADGELPERRRLSPEGVHVIGEPLFGPPFGWAPDGSALVVTSTPSPKFTDLTVADLVVVGLDGQLRTVLSFEGFGGSPRFSPDGSTIVYNGTEGAVPALFTLLAVPAAGGTPQVLMPGFEGSVFVFDWLPDGKRLLAIAQRRQQQDLVVVEAGTATGAIAPFDRPGAVELTGFSLSTGGRRVAFARSDAGSHPDVYVADLDGPARKLTDLNPWTRDHDFGEVRDISWTSFDGLQIEGLLRLPAGYTEGQRYPMLLEIHGGPAGAFVHTLGSYAMDWGRFMAERGYVVLYPNPRGSSGRGTEFLRGIVGCYGEPDWQDLMTGVDKVIELGIADPDRLVVGGWSGGGYLTNRTITHTDRFKAAVSGAGISNWVSFQGTTDCRSHFDRYFGAIDDDPETAWRLSPIRDIKAATTPTLILYGGADDRVPPTQGYELYEGLKARGVEAQLVLFPREGHVIAEREHQLDLLRRVIDWYESHLGGDESHDAGS